MNHNKAIPKTQVPIPEKIEEIKLIPSANTVQSIILFCKRK
jgi:hypothetical protein